MPVVINEVEVVVEPLPANASAGVTAPPHLALPSNGLDDVGAPGEERLYGVYSALVTDVCDPDHQGRVKVTVPGWRDVGSSSFNAWARVATLMAGNNRGSWFMADVNDEVLIAFDGGNPNCPFVIGALWNGVDRPPESMDGGGLNDKKVLRSRNGVTLTMDDTDKGERLVLETPRGQRVTLSDADGSIRLVDCNGNSVRMDQTGVHIASSATITLEASQVNIAAGVLAVDAGVASFSGVVKADTVICTNVVSASYTPGAGNIW